MKKTVIVLLALIFAAPAMAVDAVFDINDLGSGIIAIDYNANAAPNNVSAFALKVSVDSGTIVAVTDFHVGESNSLRKGYGIFPCNIDINQTTGIVELYGNPVAPNTATDAAGTGIDTNSVILELGALYEDGNAPPPTGTLCKLKLGGLEIGGGIGRLILDCNLTIAANATRGNVVLDTAAEATTNLPLTETVAACDISDQYGGIRYLCDNTTVNYGSVDGVVDFWDLQVVLYFYDKYEVNCPTLWPSDPNLCRRVDNCGVNYGPQDGYMGFWDLQAILYFYDDPICLP